MALVHSAPGPAFNARPLLSEEEIITRSRKGVLRSEADRVAALVGLTIKNWPSLQACQHPTCTD
ncbi:hypothetical protein ACO2Q8_19355 [Larkinella sp. VNQ87]|uniref:hypothetical protein n=1 Tax=Larkinella sp. VNQ87 TaxID=3400921 RepID=UPI003C06C87C